VLLVARRARRSEALNVARNLLTLVRDHTFRLPGGDPLRQRVSIGFTALPFHPGEPEWGTWRQGLDVAGQCLAAAQLSGRDRCVGALVRGAADPGFLRDQEDWPVGWAREKGLVDVQCSEPGFYWPVLAHGGR
jgi:hypothetical protein